MNQPPRTPPWAPPGGGPGQASDQTYPQQGYPQQPQQAYPQQAYPQQPHPQQPQPGISQGTGVSSADSYALPPAFQAAPPLGDERDDRDDDDDDDDDASDSASDDGPIADSPSWGAIGVLVGVVLVGAGIGAGVGFFDGGQGMVWLGGLLGSFAAAMFGLAGIGWSYRNMDWIPMSYEERTVVLVMGILFLSSPLALHILHPGH